MVVKASLELVHPYVFNGLRFSLSVLLLGLLVALKPGERSGKPFRWRLALRIVLLGSVGHVLYQIAFIEGIDRTTAGATSLILASVPAWTALIGLAFGIERISRSAWIGVGLGFVGVLLVSTSDLGSQRLIGAFSLGGVLVFGAAVAWAVYTVFSKPLLRHFSPLRLAFFSMLVGLPALWGLALPFADRAALASLPAWFWGAVAYSGALSTGFAYVAWNAGIRAVGPSQAAIYSNLVPLIGVVSGVVFLHEPLARSQLIGGTLILTGLVVMRRRRGGPPARSVPVRK